MKKLHIAITVFLFSIVLQAQPGPTTFLDVVQVAGSKETVIEQLVDAGFEVLYHNSMVTGMYKGDKVKVTISGWNEKHQQVSALSVIALETFESAEAIRRFNNRVSEYEKDPKYVADPANRKIPTGITLTHEYISDQRHFYSKFYQDGDKKKVIEVSIHEIDGKFYIPENYYNRYISNKNL